jgi:hypothetical protein
MASGTRLSEQNYCSCCEYRAKDEKGKAWCDEYAKPLPEVVASCWMLKPFKAYQLGKEEKKDKKVAKV